MFLLEAAWLGSGNVELSKSDSVNSQLEIRDTWRKKSEWTIYEMIFKFLHSLIRRNKFHRKLFCSLNLKKTFCLFHSVLQRVSLSQIVWDPSSVFALVWPAVRLRPELTLNTCLALWVFTMPGSGVALPQGSPKLNYCGFIPLKRHFKSKCPFVTASSLLWYIVSSYVMNEPQML